MEEKLSRHLTDNQIRMIIRGEAKGYLVRWKNFHLETQECKKCKKKIEEIRAE